MARVRIAPHHCGKLKAVGIRTNPVAATRGAHVIRYRRDHLGGVSRA
jgi:hypothetical protein